MSARPTVRIVLFAAALSALAGCEKLGCGKTATTQLTVDQTKERELQKRSPFTEAVISKHELSNGDLKKVQFYIAGTMNLTRKIKAKDKQEVVGGKLVQTGGETVHELLIERGTAGKCLDATGSGSSRVLTVSFDEGYALKFTPGYGSDSNFNLIANSSGSDYKVRFVGQSDDYDLSSGEKANAYLVVDLETINNIVTTRKKLGGQKIGDDPPK